MFDFTRVLYLGMRHPWAALRRWDSLTTGVPSALDSPTEYGWVAHALAGLMGLEDGVLGRSTLHLFFDLMSLLAGRRVVFFMDSGMYPIGRWAATWAAANSARVTMYRHRDAGSLRRTMAATNPRGYQPIVVTDGWCPRCGRAAPLDKYVEQVRPLGGWVIVDDTQALGILGRRDRKEAAYGRGGGGLVPWFGIAGPGIIVVASLAKGFGVPTAVLASSHEVVECLKAQGPTRMHCSPPSLADVRAAEHALTLNARMGEALRQRLLHRVRHFRHGLCDLGLAAGGSLFPVQSLSATSGCDPRVLHRRLSENGIRTVLLRGEPPHPIQLAFLLNARHNFDEIDEAIAVLAPYVQKRSPHDGKVGLGASSA